MVVKKVKLPEHLTQVDDNEHILARHNDDGTTTLKYSRYVRFSSPLNEKEIVKRVNELFNTNFSSWYAMKERAKSYGINIGWNRYRIKDLRFYNKIPEKYSDWVDVYISFSVFYKVDSLEFAHKLEDEQLIVLNIGRKIFDKFLNK